MAGKITLNAKESINQASSNLAGHTITYNAGEDITIKALANTYTEREVTNHFNTSASFGTNGSSGIDAGGGNFKSISQSIHYVGSHTTHRFLL